MSLNNVYQTLSGTPGHHTGPRRVPPKTRMVEPLGHLGPVGHHQMQAGGNDDPAKGVEVLLAALADAGRHLGHDLVAQVRAKLMMMDRQSRAELAATIDDAFELAPDLSSARRQARWMLINASARQAAMAVWPAFPEPEEPVSNVEHMAPWLALIAQHCALVPDDHRYLIHHLSGLPDAQAMQKAQRYAQAWLRAADGEPRNHRKENAGRRAANASLVPHRAVSMAKTAYRPQQQHNGTPEPLPAGVRMSWTLLVDGKRLAIAGRPMTEDEALASARSRWPLSDVEVLTNA